MRVAEPDGDGWKVNEWAKKACLLYFRVRDLETTEVGPFEYRDLLPLKRGYEASGVRRAARDRALRRVLSPGVVLMPSYVNIGAWVGPGTLVDTWATVGSRADRRGRPPVRRDRRRAGARQAGPAIVEDGAFVGSRCIVVEGVIGARAVLGAGLVITGNTPAIDVTATSPSSTGARSPPARSSCRARGRATSRPAATGCPRADHRVPDRGHRDQVQLNEMLREFGSSVGS